MSLLATLALAASGATLQTCSWDRPGHNPFMRDVVAAVDDYTDIPAATRNKLKARMANHDYDEIVLIERDRITGMAQYDSNIRDMHFGEGGICKTVTRTKWTQQMQERGLVYCEDGQCILVPTVCRNVSRINRSQDAPLVIAPGAGVPAGGAPASAGGAPTAGPLGTAPDEQSLLDFAPPGAGVPTETPQSFSSTPIVPDSPGTPSVPGSPTLPTASLPGVPLLPPGTPSTTPTSPIPPITPTGPSTPVVPEPSTYLLMGAGLGLIAWITRRKQRA